MHKAMEAVKGMLDGKHPPKEVKVKTKMVVKGPSSKAGGK